MGSLAFLLLDYNYIVRVATIFSTSHSVLKCVTKRCLKPRTVFIMNISTSLGITVSYRIFCYRYQFEGVEIPIDSRVGVFITMNPGYAGRTELPESVKALFRPVVVIVPDLQQICEIMLFSEGFLKAKVRPWPISLW